VGGPELIKALKAPFPQIDLLPVGGVEIDNTADFIRAGSAAVGVGGALINQRLLDAGDFVALTERARRLIEEVARGRSGQ
jgi:2-dehydro-3-deoxyphosphogluconate aldolase / (4S)-4-hydroxy-2-oxoglutarate aldolase